MTAFRQFAVDDIFKAASDYINTHYEMLQSSRTSKINRLMTRKWFPKKTEIEAIAFLRVNNEWDIKDEDILAKLDKIKEVQTLCSLKSLDTSVTLDAELANMLRLYF